MPTLSLARTLIFAVVFCRIPANCKLPSKFEIVWNIQSGPCKRNFNITVPVENYGVMANKGQKFYGDKVVLFYDNEDALGIYPRIDRRGKIYNGGVPQAVDLETHLKKVEKDVRSIIPNWEFSGNAVIDWEAWWPTWEQNYGQKTAYKKESMKLAKKFLPGATEAHVEKFAREQFENATKTFMLSTLALCQKLRPNAKWGFYGYPRCLHKNGDYCAIKSRKINNKWKWLFDASTALYPTIYLRYRDLKKDQSVRHKIIQAQILETKRMVEKSGREVPIYPFTRIMYDPYHRKPNNFYSKADLCSSVKQSADLGVAGVVVWGSWYSVSTKENCQMVSEYVSGIIHKSRDANCGIFTNNLVSVMLI